MYLKPTLKCYKCGEQFPRGDLVEYVTMRAKNPHRYCPKCLKEIKATENFYKKISEFYKNDISWATINKRKTALYETYGYTDQTIIDCLEYAYTVKGYVVLEKALGIVKPPLVEEMLQYKRAKEFKENQIVNAIIDGTNKKNLPQIKVRENMKPRKKSTWDDENFLFME